MKRIVASLLIANAASGLVFADAQTPAATPSAKAVASQAIKQLEQDLADAIMAGDADKVARIIADDWAGLGYDGRKASKESFLAGVKAGRDKIESVELGPMEVKLLGNVAVVQGSDIEKSVINGKDTSGTWLWMDVFERRNGVWVVVRSQSARMK